MGAIAAVGVHDDLSARHAAVSRGTADDEPARGIDVELGLFVQPLGGDGFFDDLLDDGVLEVLTVDVVAVLGGDDHDVHPLGLAVHILHRHLRLAVGTQPRHLAGLPRLGEPPRERVGEHDGQGHELRSLVRRAAEHHALVARAEFVYLVTADIVGRLVHSPRDVGRLLVERGQHRAGLVVEPEGTVVIADVLDHPAHDAGDVAIVRGAHLAEHHHHAGGGAHFHRDAGGGILREDVVQDRVGDLIAHLVGMPFRHALGSEKSFLFVLAHIRSFRWRRRPPRCPSLRERWRCSCKSSCPCLRG